jgi:hypothetical protein
MLFSSFKIYKCLMVHGRYICSSTGLLHIFFDICLFLYRCTREIYYMVKHFHRYGNWGVCFTYGTWFALRGLAAAGKNSNNCPAMRKAADFLLRAQRDNGGWGESYLSCPNKVIFNYGW